MLQPNKEAVRLFEERLQQLVLDLVAALQLADDQLRVKTNVQTSAAQLHSSLYTEEQSAVLCYVVRAMAKGQRTGGQLAACCVKEYRPCTCWAGIASGCAVSEKSIAHSSSLSSSSSFSSSVSSS